MNSVSRIVGLAFFVVVVADPLALQVDARQEFQSDKFAPMWIPASCTSSVRPDRVRISGGISAQSLKPTGTKQQLEKQLGTIRSFVEGNDGVLRTLERVRLVRPPRSPDEGGAPGNLTPFMAIQRLQADFPASVDVDAIMEKLLQLGLDRFGKSFQLNYYDQQAHVVVHWGFSNLQQELEALRKDCVKQAWEKLCALKKGDRPHPACGGTEGTAEPLLPAYQFTITTQYVQIETGSTTPFTFTYPWQAAQIESFELLGDIELRLSGALYAGGPQWEAWTTIHIN